LRIPPFSIPRLIAVLLLCPLAAVHAEPSSCPQQDFTMGLPPLSADPHLEMHADHTHFERNGVSELSGNVLMSQDGRQFSTDALRYDNPTRTVSIDTPSLFRDRDVFIIRSGSAHYNLNSDHGDFLGAQFSLPKQSSRGTSERVDIEEKDSATFTNTTYTGCSPQHETWILKADQLKLDQDEGVGTAHNAVLHFGGVPILYLPYFRFPIDDQRRSGFLAPTIGQSTNSGFDMRIPFYLNLAPNLDATLTPRYMSKRGEQIQGDLRYLLPGSEGNFHGEYLGRDERLRTERDYVDYQQQTRLSEHLAFDAHYAEVSDLNYFADLGGKYDAASTPFLERIAELTYEAPAQYTVRGLVQDFQPLAGLTSQQNPYQRLPALLFSGQTKNRYYGVGAGLDGDFSNFTRSDSVDGQRLYADPYLRWERDEGSWFAAARSDATYAYYNLHGSADDSQPANGPFARSTPRQLTLPQDDSSSQPQRMVPQYSLDGGLRFERLTETGRLQTLEPRLFYLYVPYHDQDQLPLFDSGAPDFDFPRLFEMNRYSGEDRIADANQLTTTLSTRVLDATQGHQLLSAAIGQIYRFTSPRVTLPGEELQPVRGGSDFVTDVDYALSPQWSIDGIALWSPDSGSFDRSETAVRYRGEHSRFDVSYRYLHGSYHQADASFSAPLFNNWHLASRVRYSFQDQSLLDAFAGLEYDTCCWTGQIFYRRYLATIDGEFNNGVYFSLVLKGLTHLGGNFQRLLPDD
jgi:LPS-assembly protein